ncbi:uncharacterized protein LOC100378325 [Saccoglossus kowalevskii]|uniref:WW domain-binding protein 1-like n=1 Tax=Saccoglossus kowalevskii TaxID=10224 RepID=A0ABM0GT00_SACKO|nr:PREDICTED: WW domain-binding protein 1-like [Saccoglossus kowalevskii]
MESIQSILFTFAFICFTSFTEALRCGGIYCDHDQYCCALDTPRCCYHDDMGCCNTGSVLAVSWFWFIMFLILIGTCGCCCCYQRRSQARQGYMFLRHNNEPIFQGYGSGGSTDIPYGSRGTTEYPHGANVFVSPPAYEDVTKQSAPPDQPPPAYSVK